MARYVRHFLCTLILVFLSPGLFAAEWTADETVLQDWHVAMVPFWGENTPVAEFFGDWLYDTLEEIGYKPERVDLDSLPPGIPPGGLPPHMSPAPMLSGSQSLAITGSVSYNPLHGVWLLQLYLWQVRNGRLLLTDEFVSVDRQDTKVVMPVLIGYLMSKRPPEKRAPYSLLYAGFRLGWNMQLFTPVWGARESVAKIQNADIAASLNLQFFGFEPLDSLLFGFGTSDYPPLCFMGLQVEGVGMYDFDHGGSSVTVPAMLTFTARKQGSFFSLLGGGYFLFPLDLEIWEMEVPGIAFGQKGEDLLYGWTAGLSVGRKHGPGYLSLGVRWYGDMFSSIRELTGSFYRRNSVNISVGYEVGLFEVK